MLGAEVAVGGGEIDVPVGLASGKGAVMIIGTAVAAELSPTTRTGIGVGGTGVASVEVNAVEVEVDKEDMSGGRVGTGESGRLEREAIGLAPGRLGPASAFPLA